MTDEAASKTLAMKVEETVEGFLLFLIAYLRTLAVIAFSWRSGLSDIMQESPARRRYIYPFAFLAIGGFLFSVVVAAYPAGFLGILDLIWFGDEISKNIIKNFDKAFSVTSLMTGGFPTFIAVVVLSGVAARLEERDPVRRADLAKAYRYLFGYQAAILFIWLALIIFVPASGVEVCKAMPRVCQIGVLGDVVAWATLLSFPLLFLLSPVGALVIWRWRSLSGRLLPRAARVVVSLAFFGLIMAGYATSASMPAQILEHVNPPPAVSFALEPVAIVLRSDKPSTVRTVATLKNPTDEAIVVRASDLRGTLSVADVDAARWTVNALSLDSHDQGTAPVFTLGPRQAAVLEIQGSIDIPNGAQGLLKQRIPDGIPPVVLKLEFPGSSIAAEINVRALEAD